MIVSSWGCCTIRPYNRCSTNWKHTSEYSNNDRWTISPSVAFPEPAHDMATPELLPRKVPRCCYCWLFLSLLLHDSERVDDGVSCLLVGSRCYHVVVVADDLLVAVLGSLFFLLSLGWGFRGLGFASALFATSGSLFDRSLFLLIHGTLWAAASPLGAIINLQYKKTNEKMYNNILVCFLL